MTTPLHLHDVFLSYSTTDKVVADAIVARLEARGTRCWYAPRDIAPGATYASAIVDAVRAARTMVVVVSDASNHSSHVLSEVERAVHNGIHIIPFRIEAVKPSGDLEFFLSRRHWLDAVTPPVEQHINSLCDTVGLALRGATAAAVATAAPGRRNSRVGVWLAIAAGLVLAAIAAVWPSGKTSATPLASTTNDPTPTEGALAIPTDAPKNAAPVADDERSKQGADAPGEVIPPGDVMAPTDSSQPIASDRAADAASKQQPEPARPEPAQPEQRDGEANGIRILGQGRVGLTDGADVSLDYRAEDHGRVMFTLFNTMPEGTNSAHLKLTIEDWERAAHPGGSTWTEPIAVAKGQQFTLRVRPEDGHRSTYRIEAKFESLSSLGLTAPEETGQLAHKSLGSVGFTDGMEDAWEFRAEDHGRVKFTLFNTMPQSTHFAMLKLAIEDWERAAHPDGSTWTEPIAVAKGQQFTLRVRPEGGHRATYRIEAKFESLSSLGLTAPEETGQLALRSLGSVGFTNGMEDAWEFHAEDHGRVKFTLFNTMPEGTNSAHLKLIIEDWERAAHPGGSTWTEPIAVAKGQQFTLRIRPEEGHRATYRLEAKSESLSIFGLTAPAEDGNLTGTSLGAVGFDSVMEDPWTYQAPGPGRVHFTLTNTMPEGTHSTRIFLVIDGVRVGHSDPGNPHPARPFSVAKGQAVMVSVQSDAPGKATYRLQARFEAGSGN